MTSQSPLQGHSPHKANQSWPHSMLRSDRERRRQSPSRTRLGHPSNWTITFKSGRNVWSRERLRDNQLQSFPESPPSPTSKSTINRVTRPTFSTSAHSISPDRSQPHKWIQMDPAPAQDQMHESPLMMHGMSDGTPMAEQLSAGPGRS